MNQVNHNLNEAQVLQALPALAALLRELEKNPKMLPERVRTALAALQNDLAEHGCHYLLDTGKQRHGITEGATDCVIDHFRRHLCPVAAEGIKKTECSHWRPRHQAAASMQDTEALKEEIRSSLKVLAKVFADE